MHLQKSSLNQGEMMKSAPPTSKLPSTQSGSEAQVPIQIFSHPMVHNPIKLQLVMRYMAKESPAIAEQLAQIQINTVALEQMAQRQPDFLAINPNGLLPALVHGEQKLWESNAIAQYLANIFGSRLWPGTPWQQASTLRWLQWEASRWSAVAGPIVFYQVYLPFWGNPGNRDRAEEAVKKLAPLAAVLDQQLQLSPCIDGDNYTLADLCIAAPMMHFETAEIDLTPYPDLNDWYQHISEQTWWQEVKTEVLAFMQSAATV
ncbi:glutathione S-transferase [Microbulbifer bruguierae]|uniref:Glutathione S-transferase n=1 Tax=Microbulbifer bruguierae TaxID=3029061 RepID=A0ABY8NG41_9GAMM|nr:glutathione S-transferase [Microbulbifer bruguierae]WGL17334.1 glutathione S-transferase [Microbulbifer bruguierae]